nr:hypothetical protein [Mycobacterium sp. E3298]
MYNEVKREFIENKTDIELVQAIEEPFKRGGLLEKWCDDHDDQYESELNLDDMNHAVLNEMFRRFIDRTKESRRQIIREMAEKVCDANDAALRRLDD